MNIAARFTCQTVLKSQYGELVTLAPVYSNDRDSPNFSFSEATPSGKIEMQMTNKSAFGAFVAGREYDIEFRPTIKAAN